MGSAEGASLAPLGPSGRSSCLATIIGRSTRPTEGRCDAVPAVVRSDVADVDDELSSAVCCCCCWATVSQHNNTPRTLIKGSPYSITERRVPELIPVLGSQPAGDVSHKPGGRLPLLPPGLQLPPQPLRGLVPICCLVNRDTMGVNSLPKTATGTHVPYGITQCYLPSGRGDIPAFTPAEAGTRFSDPRGIQG